MKVAISGSSGQVGSALASDFRSAGYDVLKLVRRPPESNDEVCWYPEEGHIDSKSLDGVDAVVHMSGEPMANGRWSVSRKSRIRRSRTRSTHLLATTLASLKTSPSVFISASAMGFYGDRGDEVLTETSSCGRGFLAEVAMEWEAAATPAAESGIRTVQLRSGLVLSGQGEPLRRLVPLFRLYLGAVFGDGKQYWPWIALEDVVGATRYALENDALEGPVNAVAPQTVTNAEFTSTLNKAMGRPTLIKLPKFAVRVLWGEMGTEMFLNSARIQPKALEAAGYKFKYTSLEDTVRHVVGRL